VDDEPWRSVPVDIVRQLGLRQGGPLLVEECAASIALLEPRLARERCLRLLNVRERTSVELHGRLLQDGYSEAVADETVAGLVASGLVDDARYAEAASRVLIVIRGLGRTRALRELTRRGVPDALAAEALDAVAPQEAESERAQECASRLARAGDTVPRLASRLVRRGFAPAAAFDAAREAIGAGQDSEGLDDW
jgi:regulatory protein